MSDQRIEKLKKELKKEEEKYYKGIPELPDDIYDFKLKKLKALGGKVEETKVGHVYSESKKFKEEHLEPMLSLNNAFNPEELCLFFDSIEKILKQNNRPYKNNEFFIEPKIDGMSISLHYKKGELIEALSRGDGIKGESLYEPVLRINSIPKKIKISENFPEEILIRGEVFILKSDFKKIQEEASEKGIKTFSNARNFVAGTLRLKNFDQITDKKLSFIAYRIIPISKDKEFPIKTQEEMIETLGKFGFTIPSKEYSKTIIGNRSNLDIFLDFIGQFGEVKDEIDIPNDGLVIKLNSLENYGIIGNTAKFPKWAIAYKYPSLVKKTKLLKIELKVGRSGRITYIGKLEPIVLNGSRIECVSLHNFDNIKKLDLKEGSTVEVCKSGEIIPQIIFAESNSELPSYEMPLYCPSCSSMLVLGEGDKLQYCRNKDCWEQKISRIVHFCSRQAVDIEGLSRGIIEKLINKGFLTNILDIYSLKEKEEEIYSSKDLKIKKKLFKKLVNSIEESKKASPQKILIGLGIDHIGGEAAKLLLKKFSSLNELFNSDLESKLNIPKVGPKSGYSLENWLKDEDNKKLIEGLKNLGFNFHKGE
ncbi:NAD-dependent DNA ligase LigA [Mycoplasma parvum]|uniref:DNA ligase n=1 Tax=Mycoplasma parvum str. Indiana TaxID=1403316 RepID=U5NC14_9MOLU|nr:NAD-dependent DNA ligase LigA [Mycoplasma parvum]AGX89116.1 DNA ligase [Mycoplasma parvum str. Indiana]